MKRSPKWSVLAFTCASAVLACSGGSGGAKVTTTPCSRGELNGCDVACDDATPCSAGLYCDTNAITKAGTCSAQCTTNSAPQDCGEGGACSADGKCSEGAGNNSGGAGDGGNNGIACGEVKLEATTKTPNVIVIVDQSGSMNEDFGNAGTRWEVLKASLLAQDGLFAELESVVRFGVVLYSGEGDDNVCPHLTQVDVAIDNLAAIRAVYEPEDPLDDTPTGDTIDSLLNQIENTALVTGEDPTIFVLATDGEPDTCAEPNPQNGQEESVAAVTRAYGLGIRTYLIAVAQEDELSEDHLRDMANAGVGVTAGQPDAPSYRVDDDAGLRTALRGIVGGELSCNVALKGKVTAKDPCVGTVRLDGKPLECNSDNGWKLVNESSLEITGDACKTLKTGKTLEASFPCDAAVVI